MKTIDLPEPVKAMPIKSLPDKTHGNPYIWIGVGFSIILYYKYSTKGSGNRISLNVFIGGGKFSPSIKMWYFYKIYNLSISLIYLYSLLGLQL